MPISQIVTNSIADDVTVKFADGSASTPSITATGDTNTGIFFPAADTIAFSEGGVEAMRIDASGNVGIGTSSPACILDLQGDNDSKLGFVNCDRLGNPSGFRGRRVNGTYSSPTQVLSGELFAFYGGGGSTNVGTITGSTARIAMSAAENFTSTANGSIIQFDTTPIGSTTVTERMRIDSSGNLTVGGTSPLGKVGIHWNSSTQQGLVLRTSSSTFNAFPVIFYNNVDVSSGTISQSQNAVSYNTSSDYRLKENIAPMTGALDKVSALKPVTYNWKVDGSSGQGFIAHELQEVVPDCVTGEKDAVDAEGKPVYQGIDTSFLVATLTAAIQELKAEFDEYKRTHP